MTFNFEQIPFVKITENRDQGLLILTLFFEHVIKHLAIIASLCNYPITNIKNNIFFDSLYNYTK